MPQHFKGAVLFDLDGTLVDTACDFSESINDIRATNGLDALPIEVIRQHVSNGAAEMIKCAFPKTDTRAKNEQIAELLTKCEHNLGLHASVFEGVQPLIAVLTKNNIAWGIITNREKRFTLPLLNKLSLRPSQNIIVCPDDVQHPKPSPEGILLAIDQLNIAPEDCIYVGDHQRDIEAAKNANIRSIACEYGYLSKADDIKNWQADFIVKNVPELQSLLKTLFLIN